MNGRACSEVTCRERRWCRSKFNFSEQNSPRPQAPEGLAFTCLVFRAGDRRKIIKPPSRDHLRGRSLLFFRNFLEARFPSENKPKLLCAFGLSVPPKPIDHSAPAKEYGRSKRDREL